MSKQEASLVDWTLHDAIIDTEHAKMFWTNLDTSQVSALSELQERLKEVISDHEVREEVEVNLLEIHEAEIQ